MKFEEELRRQRKAAKLTINSAAARLNLTRKAYRSYENGGRNPSVLEKLGLLTGLGMDRDRAREIAGQPIVFEPFADAAMDRPSPLVHIRQTPKTWVFNCHDGTRRKWVLHKRSIRNGRDALRQVRDLADKSWVDTEHLGQFCEKALGHLDAVENID